jgi:hypothetical protein
MSDSPYISTIIAGMFTCIMGVMYLASFHIEHVPDDIFRQAFIAGVTLVSGSIAVERVQRANSMRNGKDGTNGNTNKTPPSS